MANLSQTCLASILVAADIASARLKLWLIVPYCEDILIEHLVLFNVKMEVMYIQN